MKLLKKTLAALLVLIMMLGFVPADVMAASSAYTAYTDVNGHWAAGAINRVNSMGFIDPEVFPGNRFYPGWYITRAEFFSLVVNALGATATANVSGYMDLDPNTWQLEVVSIANRVGLANGYPDGTMRPNDNILRQEAATLVAKTLGMTSEAEWNLSRFFDSAFISEYARTYVAAFVEKGLLTGYPDGNFRPSAFITRAEAVVIIDRVFNHVYMPETGFRNVYLQGGLLIQTPGAELRDAVIDGDVTIGDGVGSGSVYITNTTINGKLIVRGGGPNSVVLSNTTVADGIYMASFVADTRLSVTDNSYVPVIEAVSGFTLAGSGVPEITILDNAKLDAIINLTGVNLNDFIVNGPGSQIRLNSGHIINLRVNDGGQGMSLNLAANTSVGHLTISAPNVAVTGTGSIRNLIVNHSGATVAQEPELLTLGVNVIATVAGKSVSSTESQWSNNIDRSSGDSPLKVELLTNTSALAPFDQATLRLNMVAGRTSSEVHISQSAASSIPLTQRGNRYGFWIGYFIPAPAEAGSMASITYSLVDGEPITLPPRALDTYQGRRGLLIYLPVFREQGREVGLVREVLYINWGAHLTENIQFVSSTIHLATLNTTQTANLQRDFDNRIMYSIQQGASPYTGAEATRRILNSDNPLGLPSTNNRGLDAMNRAVTSSEARSILEDLQFATELGVATSGNSQYSALSNAGKQYVSEQVLAARRTSFATASAVKAAFDRAVQARLSAETTLLGQINASADYAALRRIIETAANAAILQFQTGADPYKSYSASQKDAMADYLWRLRQYRSIQEVIDAIQRYLNDPANAPGGGEGSTDIRDLSIRRIALAMSPSGATLKYWDSRVVTLSVELTDGSYLTSAQIASLLTQGVITFRWDNGGGGPPMPVQGAVAEVIPGTLANEFIVRCNVRNTEPRSRTDRLTFTLMDSTNKSFTANLSFTVDRYIKADRIVSISPNPAILYLNRPPIQMNAVLSPANSNETVRWSVSPRGIISIDENTGIATPLSPGVVTITAEIEDPSPGNSKTMSVQARVYRDANDVVVDPASVILTPGGTITVTAFPATAGKQVIWASNSPFVTVAQSGTTAKITAVRNITPSSLPMSILDAVSVKVVGSTPNEENDFSGLATVNVDIRRDTGIVALLRYDSIMFSGDTNIVDTNVTDEAMMTQSLYVKVEAVEPSDGNIARYAGNEAVPVRIGDPIGIIAADTGIGRAAIRLYASPEGGDPVAELYITVAPKSPANVVFNTTATTGTWYPSINAAGEGRRYPAGEIYIDTYGRVLEMQISDRPTVTAVNDSGRLTNMVWTPYVSNHLQEVLYTVRTSGASGEVRDRDGVVLMYPAGTVINGILKSGPILFEDIFDFDGGPVGPIASPTGYEFHTPSAPTAEWRLGFFKRDTPDHIRSLILRGGGLKRYTTEMMTATNGVLIPDNTQPTGLAAVVVSPRRNPMSEQMTGIWGDLYWRDQTPLFETRGDGTNIQYFNQHIAPQSGFMLMNQSDGTPVTYPEIMPDGVTVNNIYEVQYTHVTGSPREYYIADINGVEVFGRVAAIMIGDPNLETNTFYVRLLPDPIDRTIIPAVINDRTPWLPTPVSGPAPDPYTQQILFTPGSRDKYDYLLPGELIRPLDYPYLVANNLPGGSTDVGSMSVRSLDGTAFFVFIETPYPETPPTEPFTYYYSITQVSKQGFAPLPGEAGGRQNPRESTTYTYQNRTPLEYILDMYSTEPMPPINLVYDEFALTNDYDLETFSMLQFYLGATAAGYNLANLQNSTFTVTPPDTSVPPLIVILPGNTIRVNAPNPSPIANNSRTIVVTPPAATTLPTLTFIVTVTSGIRPSPASIEIDFDGFAFELPGVFAAAMAAGIDYDTAIVESEDPSALTIDNGGKARAHKPGRVGVRIRSRDGTRTANVTIEIAGSNAPTPPTDPASPENPAPPAPPATPAITALALRTTAGVGVGKTMTLIPYMTPYNSDKSGVRWTSSDESIATVNNAGVVTGVKAGNATITVIDASGNIKAECAVTVKADSRATTSIALSKRTLTLNAGASSTLTVTYRPSNATIRGANWTSSNESVARVEPNGRVVGVSAGTAVITATSDSGARTATCTVTVVVRVESVTIPDASISLKIGQTYQITPTVNPSNATNTTAKYSTRSSSIASVSSSGLVTARRAGTTTITVTIDGKTASLRVTVTR